MLPTPILENLVPFANDSGQIATLERCRDTMEGSSDDSAFQPSPIDPSWILDGNPIARSQPLVESHDGLFTGGHWDCTAGRFNFYYRCDEIVRILEGSVTVEVNGASRTLRPGDVALFSEGDAAIWTVHGHVRKFAIFRVRQNSLWSRISRRFGKLIRSFVRPTLRSE